MLVLLLSAALAAPCPSPTFSFHGQPDCVSLTFTGSRTELVNRCAAPLLVDQSVLLGQGPWILPDTRAELRDLSAFSLGMDGELFQVVAVLEACEATEETARSH